MDKEEYLKERREWKNTCRESEKEWKKELDAELKGIKHENEVWKFINKYRKKKKKVVNNIMENEWVEYFMKLLGGAETEKLGERRKREQVDKEEIKLDEWEIKKAWRGLKKKKAAGFDGSPNEV